jgi:hypothetical protein
LLRRQGGEGLDAGVKVKTKSKITTEDTEVHGGKPLLRVKPILFGFLGFSSVSSVVIAFWFRLVRFTYKEIRQSDRLQGLPLNSYRVAVDMGIRGKYGHAAGNGLADEDAVKRVFVIFRQA